MENKFVPFDDIQHMNPSQMNKSARQMVSDKKKSQNHNHLIEDSNEIMRSHEHYNTATAKNNMKNHQAINIRKGGLNHQINIHHSHGIHESDEKHRNSHNKDNEKLDHIEKDKHNFIHNVNVFEPIHHAHDVTMFGGGLKRGSRLNDDTLYVADNK